MIGAHAPSPSMLDAAEHIGRGLVDAGCRVVTGGLHGVMEAASRGARSSAQATGGDVIGILPGLDLSTANPSVDVAIGTGLSLRRMSMRANAQQVNTLLPEIKKMVPNPKEGI